MTWAVLARNETEGVADVAGHSLDGGDSKQAAQRNRASPQPSPDPDEDDGDDLGDPILRHVADAITAEYASQATAASRPDPQTQPASLVTQRGRPRCALLPM